MNYNLPVFEVTIDDNEKLGIDEIALVSTPAIEALWVAMSKEETIKLSADGDRQILTGPALIPEKLIYRVHPKTGEQYYIKFTADVIRKIAERFFKQQKTVNFMNLEHNQKDDVSGTVLEAWIVEDTKMDKSALYGFEMPVGTWMLSVHIEDTNFWNEFVKTELVKGFSIEGQLGMSLLELSKQISIAEELSKFTLTPEEAELLIKQVLLADTYSDYPKAASENAQRALDWAEENGWGSCLTAVGKKRANQLANRERISEETIARCASFARHLQYDNKELGDGCAKLAILSWGGREMIEWSQRKLEQIRRRKEN